MHDLVRISLDRNNPLSGGEIDVLLKYADYRSDGFATDVRRLCAGVEYVF